MSEMLALGLMSGTSLDGIDAAIIRTDGIRVLECGPSRSAAYTPAFRQRLRASLGAPGPAGNIEAALTRLHAEQVLALMKDAGLPADTIDVIGFHGHTISHEPARGRTRQLGDGELLASLTGVPVVNDFRTNDMVHGGQGAPFAPLYHWALARELPKPLAVLNLGGVGNVTWIGEGGAEDDGVLLAFDTGPGNALIDDWMRDRRRVEMDEGGRLAAEGRLDEGVLAALMDDSYFELAPPKSVDRLDFSLAAARTLDDANGAATLTAFTVEAVRRAQAFFPAPVTRWLVTGGGRHNRTLMAGLARALTGSVETVEAVGWDGTMLEAQAFGFLAVRSFNGQPLSVPGTTGVSHPVVGGVRHAA